MELIRFKVKNSLSDFHAVESSLWELFPIINSLSWKSLFCFNGVCVCVTICRWTMFSFEFDGEWYVCVRPHMVYFHIMDPSMTYFDCYHSKNNYAAYGLAFSNQKIPLYISVGKKRPSSYVAFFIIHKSELTTITIQKAWNKISKWFHIELLVGFHSAYKS